MNSKAQTAWEIIRSRSKTESIYSRIGKGVKSVIASDVSAIEVFDRNGDYAERRWSDAETEISRNFDRFLENRFSHPLFQEFVVSGLRNPVRISDCTDDRGFRATGMFNEFFRIMGISRQMAVALPTDSIGTPVLALARPGADYTPEDKRVLRELIPRIRRQIAAEQTWGHYDLLMSRLLGSESAVALIAFHAYVVHSTPNVADILARYFPDDANNRYQLPAQLVCVLRNRSGALCSKHEFRSQESESTLVVTACESENSDQLMLLFKEIESPRRKLSKRFDLSPRLVDVLLLVEEGCSNQQIADRLQLSPNTIRTTVEKLLHRLNVSNRTQAASLARRCLDDA